MSKKNMESTRELMGTKEVTNYSVRTYRNDELVYFLIQPSNISVLSQESLSARIYGLMTVLKGITEIEMMCLNSRENFEDNKRYLKKRMEEETNPAVRKLLEKDANYLDRMQVFLLKPNREDACGAGLQIKESRGRGYQKNPCSVL